MAQKVVVHLVDDLDGSDADQTVKFALEGVSYELDLSADNAEKLRQALQPWVSAARRTSGRSSRSSGRRDRSASAQSATIREWAKSHGYTVSDRGRIPEGVREAYAAAAH